MGNEQSTRHDNPIPSSPGQIKFKKLAKPIKSAIKRSQSVKTNATSIGIGERDDRSIRYIPRGLDEKHSGLIMPTRPVGHEKGNAGGDSPQWGWYINTTPPPPEMYCSRPSQKSEGKSETSTASQSSFSTWSATRSDMPAGGPNRVFKGLQSSAKAPMGWPSFPL